MMIGAISCAYGAQAASSTWSAAYWLGYHRSPSAIVQYKLTTFTGLLGKPNWSVDLYSFAGAQLSDQSPLGGFDLGKSWSIASNVQGFLGAGFSVAAGKPSGFGLAAGLSVQF